MFFMPNDEDKQFPTPEKSKAEGSPILDIRSRALERSKRLAFQATRSFQPGQDNAPGPKQDDSTLHKPKKKMLPAFWYRLSRRGKILVILAIVLILAGVAAAFYTNVINKTKGSTQVTKVAKKEPTTVASPLTGVQVAPELAKRPVTGIMIENSLDARPQSGLQDAGVIYEAIAEGGITRFIALFQENTPQYIGPVRSLRPYYIDWATPFDAGIAHVGGSPEALAQVRAPGQKDLDQFFNSGAYWRVDTRVSPHNLYTSFDKLDALNAAKGYTVSKFAPWPRSKKESPLKVPAAKSINFNIASANFNVNYSYDAATNSYLRSVGGAPHISTVSAEDKTGQQLKPKVVIALVMPFSIIDGSGHGGYTTDGSGTMFLFQDGGATKGTWTKPNRGAMFSFKDPDGRELKLNPGQTLITALGSDTLVSYGP